VCVLLQYLLQSCSRAGRGIVEDMCYESERRRAEALGACVYYCSACFKAVRGGEGDSGERVYFKVSGTLK
jgi:hypothetical protein